jgi:hypothetical protein
MAGTADEVREQAAFYAGKVDTLMVKVSLVDMKGLEEYLVHHYRTIKALTTDRG